MRYSEIITLYLAAGAPFAAAHFLQDGRLPNRALRLSLAACVMALWPLALWLKLTRGERAAQTEDDEDGAMMLSLSRAERAKERLLAALYNLQELARLAAREEDAAHALLERRTRAVCESIEKYTGLTLAASAVDFNGPPSEREMELCRVAGRTGEDLLLAGRCLHRRNSAQVLAHRERARAELLQTLSGVRQSVWPQARSSSQEAASHRRHLSVALIKFYGHAINLLSVLEDEGASMSVARLLDAECARLRRLESDILPDAVLRAAEGEVCTTGQLPQSQNQRLLPTQIRSWTRNSTRV